MQYVYRMIVALGALAIVSQNIHAQVQTSRASKYSQRAEVSTGFQVGIVKSFFNAKPEGRISGVGNVKINQDLEQNIGVRLGYSKIPLNQIGFLGGITLQVMEDTYGDENIDTNALRVDGNIAFAPNDILYGYAGVNINSFISGTGYEDLNPGLGFQVGVGLAVLPELNLTLAYVQTNNSGTLEVTDGFSNRDLDIDQEISGLEIGFVGTF